MAQLKTVCGGCGREITLEEHDERKFCPYCGAALSERPESAEAFRLSVEKLNSDVILGLQEYRSRLNEIYTDLGTTKNLYKIIVADDIVSRDECHRLYRVAALAQLEQARGLIASAPPDSESQALARKLARDVTHFFLHAKSRFSDAGKWTLVACEHETEKLLPYIDDAELEQIYKMYVRETPKNEMLPNQRGLIKAMHKRLKKPLFGR